MFPHRLFIFVNFNRNLSQFRHKPRINSFFFIVSFHVRHFSLCTASKLINIFWWIFENRILTLSVQFCRGFSSGVGYVGTAEADIVLVPGHRVVTVKVLDMVMVMVNVLVMVITMVMVMEWMVRTIGDG